MKKVFLVTLFGTALCTPPVYTNQTPDVIRDRFADLMDIFARDIRDANPEPEEITVSWKQLELIGAQYFHYFIVKSVSLSNTHPNHYLPMINRLNEFLSHTSHAFAARHFMSVFSAYRSHRITRRTALEAFTQLAPRLGVEQRNR